MHMHLFLPPQFLQQLCSLAAILHLVASLASILNSHQSQCNGTRLLQQNRQKKIPGEAYNNCYIVLPNAQPFFLENDNDTVLLAESGSLFKIDKRNLIIQAGKVAAMVGKLQPVSVKLRMARVLISARSVVVLQVSEQCRFLRIACLEGSARTVTLSRENRSFVVNAGEELVLAKTGTQADEMVPTDGVDRELLVGDAVMPDLLHRRNRFDPQMMLEKEKVLVISCMGGFTGGHYQAKKKINLLKDRICKAQRTFHP